jgi:hypothetical protein
MKGNSESRKAFINNEKASAEFLKKYGHTEKGMANYGMTYYDLVNNLRDGIDVLQDPLFNNLDHKPRAAIILLALENELKGSKDADKIKKILDIAVKQITRYNGAIANTNYDHLFNIIHSNRSNTAFASYIELLRHNKPKQKEVLGWLLNYSLEDFSLGDRIKYLETVHNLENDRIISAELAQPLKGRFKSSIIELNISKLDSKELITEAVQIAELLEKKIIIKDWANAVVNKLMAQVKKDSSVFKGQDDFYTKVLPLMTGEPHPLIEFIFYNRKGAWGVINKVAEANANEQHKGQHNDLLKSMLEVQVLHKNFADVKGGSGLVAALQAAKEDTNLQVRAFNAITEARKAKFASIEAKRSDDAEKESTGYDKALFEILTNKDAAKAIYESVKGDEKKLKALLALSPIAKEGDYLAPPLNRPAPCPISSFIYQALDTQGKAEFIANPNVNPLEAITGTSNELDRLVNETVFLDKLDEFERLTNFKDLEPQVKKVLAVRIMSAVDKRFNLLKQEHPQPLYEHLLPYLQERHDLVLKLIKIQNANRGLGEGWQTVYSISEKNSLIPIMGSDNTRPYNELLAKIIDQQIKDKAFVSKNGYLAAKEDKLIDVLKQINDPKLNMRVFDEINRAIITTTKVLEINASISKVLHYIMQDKASAQELYNRAKNTPKELRKLLTVEVYDEEMNHIPMSLLIYNQLNPEQKVDFLKHEQVELSGLLQGKLTVEKSRAKQIFANNNPNSLNLIQLAADVQRSDQFTQEEKDVLKARLLARVNYKDVKFFGAPPSIPDDFVKDLEDLEDPTLNLKVFKAVIIHREKLIKDTHNFTAITEAEKKLYVTSDKVLWLIFGDMAAITELYNEYKKDNSKMRKLISNANFKDPDGKEWSIAHMTYLHLGFTEGLQIEFLRNKEVNPIKILIDISKGTKVKLESYVEFIGNYISALPNTQKYMDTLSDVAMEFPVTKGESIKAQSMLEFILKVDARNGNQDLFSKFAEEVLVKDRKAKHSAVTFGDRVKVISRFIDNLETISGEQKHGAKMVLYGAIMKDKAARHLALNDKDDLVDRKYMLLCALEHETDPAKAAKEFKEIMPASSEWDTTLNHILSLNISEDLKLRVINAALSQAHKNINKSETLTNTLSLANLSSKEGARFLTQFVDFAKTLSSNTMIHLKNEEASIEVEPYIINLFGKIQNSPNDIKKISEMIIQNFDAVAIKKSIDNVVGRNPQTIANFIIGALQAADVNPEKVEQILRHVAEKHPNVINNLDKKQVSFSEKQQAAVLLGFADGKEENLYEKIDSFRQITEDSSISLTNAESIKQNFNSADPTLVQLLAVHSSDLIIKDDLSEEDAVKIAKSVFAPEITSTNPNAFNNFMLSVYHYLIKVDQQLATKFLDENPGILIKAIFAVYDKDKAQEEVDKLIEALINGKDLDIIKEVYNALDKTRLNPEHDAYVKDKLFQEMNAEKQAASVNIYVTNNFDWLLSSSPESMRNSLIDISSELQGSSSIALEAIANAISSKDSNVADKAAKSMDILLNSEKGRTMVVNTLQDISERLRDKDGVIHEIESQIAILAIIGSKDSNKNITLEEIGAKNGIIILSWLLPESPTVANIDVETKKVFDALTKDITPENFKLFVEGAYDYPYLFSFVVEQKPELFKGIMSSSAQKQGMTYGDMYIFDKIIKEDKLTAVEAAELLLKAYNDPANKDNHNLRAAIEQYYGNYVQQGFKQLEMVELSLDDHPQVGVDGLAEREFRGKLDAINKTDPALIAKFFRKAAEVKAVGDKNGIEVEGSWSILETGVEVEVNSSEKPVKDLRPENLLMFDFKVLAKIHAEYNKNHDFKEAEGLGVIIQWLLSDVIEAIASYLSKEDKALADLADNFTAALTTQVEFSPGEKAPDTPVHGVAYEEGAAKVTEPTKSFAAKIAQKAEIVKKGLSPEAVKTKDSSMER